MRKHSGGRGSRTKNNDRNAGSGGMRQDYDTGGVSRTRREYKPRSYEIASPVYVGQTAREIPKGHFPALVEDLEMYSHAEVGIATIQSQVERRFVEARQMVRGLGDQTRQSYTNELEALRQQYELIKRSKTGSKGLGAVTGQMSPEELEKRGGEKKPRPPRQSLYSSSFHFI